MLTADSFGGAARGSRGAARGEDEGLVVSLLLADPTDELRHLTVGEGVTPQLAVPVIFVDSLEGLRAAARRTACALGRRIQRGGPWAAVPLIAGPARC